MSVSGRSEYTISKTTISNYPESHSNEEVVLKLNYTAQKDDTSGDYSAKFTFPRKSNTSSITDVIQGKFTNTQTNLHTLTAKATLVFTDDSNNVYTKADILVCFGDPDNPEVDNSGNIWGQFYYDTTLAVSSTSITLPEDPNNPTTHYTLTFISDNSILNSLSFSFYTQNYDQSMGSFTYQIQVSDIRATKAYIDVNATYSVPNTPITKTSITIYKNGTTPVDGITCDYGLISQYTRGVLEPNTSYTVTLTNLSAGTVSMNGSIVSETFTTESLIVSDLTTSKFVSSWDTSNQRIKENLRLRAYTNGDNLRYVRLTYAKANQSSVSTTMLISSYNWVSNMSTGYSYLDTSISGTILESNTLYTGYWEALATSSSSAPAIATSPTFTFRTLNDKLIYVSFNGNTFNQYRALISVDGGPWDLLTKNNLIIQESYPKLGVTYNIGEFVYHLPITVSDYPIPTQFAYEPDQVTVLSFNNADNSVTISFRYTHIHIREPNEEEYMVCVKRINGTTTTHNVWHYTRNTNSVTYATHTTINVDGLICQSNLSAFGFPQGIITIK